MNNQINIKQQLCHLTDPRQVSLKTTICKDVQLSHPIIVNHHDLHQKQFELGGGFICQNTLSGILKRDFIEVFIDVRDNGTISGELHKELSIIYGEGVSGFVIVSNVPYSTSVGNTIKFLKKEFPSKYILEGIQTSSAAGFVRDFGIDSIITKIRRVDDQHMSMLDNMNYAYSKSNDISLIAHLEIINDLPDIAKCIIAGADAVYIKENGHNWVEDTIKDMNLFYELELLLMNAGAISIDDLKTTGSFT